jgi:hypothetical protein
VRLSRVFQFEVKSDQQPGKIEATFGIDRVKLLAVRFFLKLYRPHVSPVAQAFFALAGITAASNDMQLLGPYR